MIEVQFEIELLYKDTTGITDLSNKIEKYRKAKVNNINLAKGLL